MKLVRIYFLVCLLLLSGCSKSTLDTSESKKFEEYKISYNNLLTNDRFAQEAIEFDLSYEVSKLPDGTYRYYVIIDNPKASMFNVKVLAIEEGTDRDEVMAPSIGIFEDSHYNLVPSQVNIEGGFVKGVVLSGDSVNDTINLRIMVSWNDKENKNRTKEFIQIQLKSTE